MPKAVHHVNLSVPEDGATDEGRWLVDMLGYREVAAGPELTEMVEKAGRRVWWFEDEAGSQIHLSPNPDHAVVARCHTAIRLGDDFDACLARLVGAGFEIRTSEFDGLRRGFVTDPAGNLWELVAA